MNKFVLIITLLFVCQVNAAEKESAPIQISCKETTTFISDSKEGYKGKAEEPKSPMTVKYLLMNESMWMIGTLGKEKLISLSSSDASVSTYFYEKTGAGNINMHTMHVIGKDIFMTIQKSIGLPTVNMVVSTHMKCKVDF